MILFFHDEEKKDFARGKMENGLTGRYGSRVGLSFIKNC
jgi:hypothetical protein